MSIIVDLLLFTKLLLWKEPRYEFDWVTGAVADDKAVDVVAEFFNG